MRQSKLLRKYGKTKTENDSRRMYLRASQDLSTGQIHKIFKCMNVPSGEPRGRTTTLSSCVQYLERAFFFRRFFFTETTLPSINHLRLFLLTLLFSLSQSECLTFSLFISFRFFKYYFCLTPMALILLHDVERRAHNHRYITPLHGIKTSNYWQCLQWT